MPRKDGDAVGVTQHDDNYLGTSPEYKNSAYEVNAPIVDQPDEVTERVREHVEAMEQPQPEVKSFGDWKAERDAERTAVEEDDDDSEEATKAELMEEARELEVEGRSTMTKEELAEAVEARRQASS